MKIQLLILVISLFSCLSSIAQTFTSQNSDEWSQNNTWVGNAPGYTLGNNTNVTINPGHVIYTDQGLTLSGMNGGALNINGKLTINGNLIVSGNNWDVNVNEGGEFIVNGNIQFDQPANSDQASPDLTINGVVTITGNLSGTGNLLGDGELYMNEGEISTGVKVNLFDGNIVYGVTDLTLPVPFGLGGLELIGPKVDLAWGFAEPSPVEFIGFQVFRNNDSSAPSYLATVLPGIEDLLGVTITTPDQMAYLDDDLENGDTPKYYVRAVYYINDEVVYSGISNVVDFLNTPLPIELLSFLAISNDQTIEICWISATEINNDFFTIERSIDARSWEILGTVTGAGTTSQVQNYSYTDNLPVEGLAYYRLKQTDFDGTSEYYGPVAAAFGGGVSGFNLKVLTSRDYIQVVVPGGEAGQLDIYDINGKRLVSQFARGTVALPMATGTYIIRFTSGLDAAVVKVVM